MTRAKDISKIVTDANLSGTLDVTGDLTVDTNTLHVDSTNNRVGIGTSSINTTTQISKSTTSTDGSVYPTLKIENTSAGSGNSYARFQVNGGNGTTGFTLLADGRSSNSDVSLRTTTNTPMSFYTNNTERMRITAAGNVGIGINPQADFHMSDASDLRILFTTDQTGNASSDGTFIGLTDGGHFNIRNRESTNINLYTSNTERMRIDSSGNVGIGKSSYGSISTDGFWWESASNYLALSANGTSPIYMNRNGSDGGLINFYKSGSNVGNIGTFGSALYIASPDGTDAGLRVGNSTVVPVTTTGALRDNAIDLGSASARFKDLYLSGSVLTSNIYGQNDGNTGIQFEGSDLITIHTGGSERLRITSGGDVLVGTNSNTLNSLHFVHSSGGQHAMGSRVGTNGNFALGVLNSSGTVVGGVVANASSTAYNTSSDHRLKENVTANWDATTRLKQLNPVRFNFIADADTTVDGFLAHEVQSVVPEAITGTHNEVDADGNPVYQGIDQSKLVPLLVKTIQELEARIVALETA